MSSVISQAQPALTFIPPCYSPIVRHAMKRVIPTWMRLQTPIHHVDGVNVETLTRLYHQFENKQTRLLLAFRHPSICDPYVLGHLLWQLVPQQAQQLGLSLGTTHAHFLYDRGIPLWAGKYLGWVFSRLGGIPIQRGKLDLTALKKAREVMVDGRFPLAAAPEGGTNGHNEVISQLEPGIAQLAFWCTEDLRAAGRNESVTILPIGIQYRYQNPPWEPLRQVLSELEEKAGLASAGDLDFYDRLYRLADHLLSVMEAYYQDFYGLTFQPLPDELNPNDRLAVQLKTLMDEALKVSEAYFHLRPKGSVIDRCRRVEQAGFDRIFSADPSQLSDVDRGLANRIAEEASLRMWHMRLVESFVAVTGHYVKERPTADRFAETVLLLHDMVDKLQGKVPSRPNLGEQRAIVTVGQPLRADERFDAYKKSRRRAIAALTTDLQTAMGDLLLP